MERSADWLRQAKRDLEKAGLDLKYEFYEWACFTSQQAAEKALKAVYQKAHSSVRGHSVSRMLEGLKENFAVPDELVHFGKVLDRYYIEGRYPNGFPEGSPADYLDEIMAREAVDASGKIIGFCEDTLGRL